MKKYLKDYIQFITQILNSIETPYNIEGLKKEHLIQIQFIQHERLIHLIVMSLFAIVLFISIGIFLITEKISILILIILLLILLIPYVAHYYFLENSTQKLYTIYNQMCELEKSGNRETEKL